MDYWDLNNKAFNGNWIRTEKIELNQKLRKLVYNPKYVWVSHEHTDHFDPLYLKQLGENTTILLPNFVDNFFLNKVKSLDLKCSIRILDSYKWINIESDLKVKVILEQPEYTCHSSILIDNGNLIILHNGDSSITPKFLDYVDVKYVDYFLAQYTPPTPYPWTNENMSEKEKNSIFDSILDSQLKHFSDSCRSLSVKKCNTLRWPCRSNK